MKKLINQNILYGLFALVLLLAILLWPKQSADGIWAGLVSCGQQIIPALFPFFVVSSLIIASPLADWLGLILIPFTRYGLGITSRQAATTLLISWVGGFAVAANTISQLYRQKQINRRDAALLLVCGVGSGPAFVINTVGLMMLGSIPLGICLMAALLCANVFTAIVFRLAFVVFNHSTVLASEVLLSSESLLQEHTQAPDFVQAVRNAVDSMLTVCGFVLFFRFVCTVLAQGFSLSKQSFFVICAGLEVTTGCTAASILSGHSAVVACCVALSLQSLSVFLQVRALLCRELSITSMIWARPIHLVFSLFFLECFLRLIPGAFSAASTLSHTVIPTTRTAPDTAFILFALCCVVLHKIYSAKNKQTTDSLT